MRWHALLCLNALAAGVRVVLQHRSAFRPKISHALQYPNMSTPHLHAEPHRVNVVGRELVRAEQDFERLRVAYLRLARDEADNAVAISMVGADMDRAHTAVQLLAGQRLLPIVGAPEPDFARAHAPAIGNRSRRMAEVDS